MYAGVVYVPYVRTLKYTRGYFDLRIPKGMVRVYEFLLALYRRSYECRARALIRRIYRRC